MVAHNLLELSRTERRCTITRSLRAYRALHTGLHDEYFILRERKNLMLISKAVVCLHEAVHFESLDTAFYF